MDWQTISILLGLLVVILYGIHVWAQGPDCPDQTTRLDSKVVIITGSNTGIGFETALDLARRGAKVILASRDLAKGQAAAAQVRRAAGVGASSPLVVVKQLDLCSFDSVRAFAKDVLSSESRLDVLLNNAGCMMTQRVITKDGLETTFQANHFSHFLLTSLLMPLLKSAGKARIVNVSSLMHNTVKTLPFDDFTYTHNFSLFPVYSATKLANILFTNELARRVQGTGITVNSLHPGTVMSDIPRNFPWPVGVLYPYFAMVFLKTTRKGAQTSVWACVDPSLDQQTGQYFSDCAIVKAAPHALDVGLAKKLWEVSEKLTDAKW